MKRKIVLALASGLALLVAGCASQTSGGAGAASTAPAPGPASETSRNFNLAVKCPGVHYLKSKGWSDQQIMQQESVEQQDIPACEQWVREQPKGYVPPPPPGTPMAAKAPATGGAPAPAPQ
jgi:hypothetical protein